MNKGTLTNYFLMGLFVCLIASDPAKAFAPQSANKMISLPYRPGDEVPVGYLKQHKSDLFFTATPLPDSIFSLMQGKSYKKNCTIPRSDLRYIRCLHYTIDGKSVVGEMVVNKSIADDMVEIFKELYANKYPIERMRLVDYWNADDEKAMRDNNSSSFNFRFVSHTTTISKHGKGLAVDINPLYNPYYKVLPNGKEVVEPATAKPYLDRSKEFPYKITKGDLCYRLFTAHGFRWGGAWKSRKDYQHFELP